MTSAVTGMFWSTNVLLTGLMVATCSLIVIFLTSLERIFPMTAKFVLRSMLPSSGSVISIYFVGVEKSVPVSVFTWDHVAFDRVFEGVSKLAHPFLMKSGCVSIVSSIVPISELRLPLGFERSDHAIMIRDPAVRGVFPIFVVIVASPEII